MNDGNLSSIERNERYDILVGLKLTIEGLLVNQSTNVWNTYGGLDRLALDIEKALRHKLRLDQDSYSFWSFVQGLRLLQPTSIPLLNSLEKNYSSDLRTVALKWLHHSLNCLTLSSQLRELIADENHLKKYYQDCAFLREPSYSRALLTCLEAIENNKPSLLAEINSTLLKKQLSRNSVNCADIDEEMLDCTTLDPLLNSIVTPSPTSILHKSISFDLSSVSAKEQTTLRSSFKKKNKMKSANSLQCVDSPIDRTLDISGITFSLDDSVDVPKQVEISDMTTTKASPNSQKKINHHIRSKSHDFNNQKHSIPDAIDVCNSINFSSSVPKSFQNNTGRRHSLIDKCFVDHHDKVDGPYLRSIEDFDISSPFSRQNFHTCADLDRENAHFNVCEALISAFTQIQCKEIFSTSEEEESSYEIIDRKQKFRLSCRKIKKNYDVVNLLSTETADNYNSNASPEVLSSSTSTPGDGLNGNQVAICADEGSTSMAISQFDISENHEAPDEIPILKSPASPCYADTNSDQIPPNESNSIDEAPLDTSVDEVPVAILSAESVGLSLLKKFSDKLLLKTCDLEWIVSEEDVPQQMLPLPDHLFGSGNKVCDNHIRLRGNNQWAPPRPQIISNAHPLPNKRKIMEDQNYMCSGCGMNTEKRYANRFRYCEYLGKYFCQCCHANDKRVIPGRVLEKWDFKKYPVSLFSLNVLQKLHCDPLFDINYINPTLYQKVKMLRSFRLLRILLDITKDFINTCRMCESLQTELSLLPLYIMSDVDLYSLDDLIQVRSGEFSVRLKRLVDQFTEHIHNCLLCQAKGFICEFCQNDSDIIFPFQLETIIRCSGCRSCFHKTCFGDKNCPKCSRIKARKISRESDNWSCDEVSSKNENKSTEVEDQKECVTVNLTE